MPISNITIEKFINKPKLYILVTLVNLKMSQKLPIVLKLKKEFQKSIALAQDIIVEEMQKSFNNAVLHGGTAIWRCYNGNRFSEDIDVYIAKDNDEINNFFENLKKRGLILEKKKIGKNSLYSGLKFDNTLVRFEALFKSVKSELKDYETAEGNMTTIRTLLPEELIKEKVNAYLNRFKIRDFYDIFFLIKHVKNKNGISKKIKRFLDNFKEPIDKKELQLLIISGLTPSVKEMLSYIQREVI